MNQAQIAFFDQIVERQPAMLITTGNAHHQPQIALDQALPRGKVAGTHGTRQGFFLIGGEQAAATDLMQIQLGDVVEKTLFTRRRNHGIGTDIGGNIACLAAFPGKARGFGRVVIVIGDVVVTLGHGASAGVANRAGLPACPGDGFQNAAWGCRYRYCPARQFFAPPSQPGPR